MPRTPKIGVHLGESLQELQWLVTADIQGAQCDSAPVERFGDLTVDGELLLDVRRVLAPQEQKLGAHQAHEIRTVGGCRPGVVHRPDVGAHRNGDTVAGDRGLGGAGTRLALALREGCDAGPKLLTNVLGRIDDELASTAIDDDDGAIGNGQHGRSGTDDDGNTLRPQKNNVMGVRAAEGQQNRGDPCGVELGGLGRGEVGGDQHTGRTARTLHRCRASPAGLDRLWR